MGFLRNIFGLGAIGLLVGVLANESQEQFKKSEEEKRRVSKTCKFNEVISEANFTTMVHQAARKIKRITDIHVYGPNVVCTVCSQSGLTDWHFTLDFNDYGTLSGMYWITSENQESIIPKRLADTIQVLIMNQYM